MGALTSGGTPLERSRQDGHPSGFQSRHPDDVENSNNSEGRQQSGPSTIDLVAHRTPWAGPEELALRRRLHKAQTIAQAKASREGNGTARELLWLLSMTAGKWTFRRVEDLSILERILRALNQLFLAADNVRQVEGPDNVE